jgi:hypothetical protein
MPGLFGAARRWPLRSEIYVDRAMAFFHLTGDHRRKSRAEYEAENPFIEGDMNLWRTRALLRSAIALKRVAA